MLKSGFEFQNSIVSYPSLLMMLPFLEKGFWNGWWMTQVILSWAWCNICITQSVWCSALLSWCFELIVWLLLYGILVRIYLNLQGLFVLINNLCQINCPGGIRWCWNLLICICWRLYEVLGWYCLHSLNWKFLLWGRLYWMFFMWEINYVDIK